MIYPNNQPKLSKSSISAGRVPIEPALALAPLHEITDSTFRAFIRKIGGLGLTVSEMVSSEALVRKARKAELMLAGDGGRPFAIQIAGSRPDAMAMAASIAEESGADLVDINMGCPASNVTSGLAGSALLRDIKLAESCVRSVVGAVKVPVTVKTRIGWDEAQRQREDFLDFLRMFEANGIAAATIHPRTRSQHFSGKADWGIIEKAVCAGPKFPIIGNGDVLTPGDAQRMADETGCAGVMIGRGALYNPFIFRQIVEESFIATDNMRIEAAIAFSEFAMQRLGAKESLHKLKKFGGFFTKGIPGASSFRRKLNAIPDSISLLGELRALAEGMKES
jgi:tRNA-dihydrouridine synthase B